MPKKFKIIKFTAASFALKVALRDQLRFLNEREFDVTMVSADGPEVNEVIAYEGCPHIIIPITRHLNPVNDIITIYKLYKVLKRIKPLLIHSENLKSNLLGPIAAKLAGVPIRIQTMAGLVSPNVPGFKGWAIKMAEKISCISCTHVWPNGQSSLEYMAYNNICGLKKMEVIGKGSSNGVDLEKFNTDKLSVEKLAITHKQIDKKQDEKILLFTGRVVKDKGIEELIKVFEILQQQYTNLKLVLLGPFEKELDALTTETENKIRQNPSIVHIAWTDEVEYFMASSTLLIHPSHREGFPNVLMQAGAMKLPVVCSDIMGNIDMIRHNETGLLYKVKNEDELLDVLRFALNNTNEINKYANTFYDEVVQWYDRKKMCELYRKKYLSLIEAL